VLAIGGVAYAATTALTPASASIALRGLIPAFLGGLDSVPGALVGGLIVGILETYLVHVAGAQASDAAVSVILLVCLIFRPVGLFGSREVLRA
jgi:branched-chain amino acid transport system permease protein